MHLFLLVVPGVEGEDRNAGKNASLTEKKGQNEKNFLISKHSTEFHTASLWDTKPTASAVCCETRST